MNLETTVVVTLKGIEFECSILVDYDYTNIYSIGVTEYYLNNFEVTSVMIDNGIKKIEPRLSEKLKEKLESMIEPQEIEDIIEYYFQN